MRISRAQNEYYENNWYHTLIWLGFLLTFSTISSFYSQIDVILLRFIDFIRSNLLIFYWCIILLLHAPTIYYDFVLYVWAKLHNFNYKLYWTKNMSNNVFCVALRRFWLIWWNYFDFDKCIRVFSIRYEIFWTNVDYFSNCIKLSSVVRFFFFSFYRKFSVGIYVDVEEKKGNLFHEDKTRMM